jgi:histidinol-phosphate aminotransferase
MAGMRIGFAVGNAELIKYLNDVKYSFNSYTMSRAAISCGVESVKDDEYFKETTRKIIETREWAKEELTNLGFSFPDSMANFIFATHKSVSAKEIFEALREANIYVRYFNLPRIDNYLRITIGTRGEMEKLFGFLHTYLNK